MKQKELFKIPPHVYERYEYVNPMVRKMGFDPQRRKCKECKFIVRERYHCKVYIKCSMRGFSRGAGTDHRLKWAGCSLFKKMGEMKDG